MDDDSVGLGELTRTVHRIEEAITQQFKELKQEIVSTKVYEAEKVTTNLRIDSLETSRRNFIAATTILALGLLGDALTRLIH